jgi:hypothetical protein
MPNEFLGHHHRPGASGKAIERWPRQIASQTSIFLGFERHRLDFALGQSVHAEGSPRPDLNLRAATALADIGGGASGGDGASRRRTPQEVQMKPSTKAAKAKSGGPKKASRERGSKTVAPQKAEKPTRMPGTRSRATPEPSPAATAPHQSKQATVIALLRRPEGVTVAEVGAATGWQPHTVRGLFSGTLKKKLGLALSSAQEDRGRVYRIIGAAGTMPAAAASEGARASG